MYKDYFIVKYKKKFKNEFRKLNCNKMLWYFFYVKYKGLNDKIYKEVQYVINNKIC